MQSQSKSEEVILWIINKLILQFIGKGKRLRIANTMLKKSKVGGLKLPDFETYYKAIVCKTVKCWSKNRQTDQ